MANVLPFNRPRTYTSREAFINKIRDEIYQSQMTYRDIGHQSGVTMQTISNLATGRTQWPRPNTLFGIINALNLKIRLEK